MRRLSIRRSLSGVFGRGGEFLPVTPFLHCEFLPSRRCEERSDEAISPIAPPRHCEPKGRRVCWREAISSLHTPFGVRRSGGIASPDCYQARNDGVGLQARNDAMGLFARDVVVGMQARNDASFRHCESLPSRHCEFLPFCHCEERSDEAISPIALPRHCEPKGRQGCWREAISSLLIPVGVKCSGGIASPDCHQACNDVIGLFARNDAPFRHCESLPSRHCEERSDEAISSLHLAILFTKTLYLPDAKLLSSKV